MNNVTPIGNQGVTPEFVVNELLASLKPGDQVFFIKLRRDGMAEFGMAGDPHGLRIAYVEFQRASMAIMNGHIQVTNHTPPPPSGA